MNRTWLTGTGPDHWISLCTRTDGEVSRLGERWRDGARPVLGRCPRCAAGAR
jgi:hypothetical protein